MSYIFINPQMPREMKKRLKIFECEIIEVYPNSNLAKPVSSHPDLLVHPLPNGDLIVDRDHYQYYRDRISSRQIYPTFQSIEGKYPRNVSLNGFFIDSFFVHYLEYTDPQILDYYKSSHYQLISVKQGYSRCNTLLGKGYLMTSDPSIYEAVKDKIPIYKIHHKYVLLPGYSYGFIGGCSGRIKGRLVLTGSIGFHPSKKMIKDVFKANKEDIYYLGEGNLYDVGSILCVD